MNEQNKPGLTLDDYLQILFAILDRIEHYENLIKHFPDKDFLCTALDKLLDLRDKIKGLIK